MNWIETRIFKVVSFVVLFFFSWTFGGVFDIAYAMKDSVHQSAISGQQRNEDKKPEEKFQKVIEDIEGILSDTVTDTDTKKSKLKAKKTEIESLDVEIRKQFTETEDKIKDLPEEIKQRHRDFVKKYEDNLKEFKADLDDIDRATTTQEIEISFKKAKEFLEKVKPPKKRVPLDPNKLPHRTPEVEKKEPRTKPEEFLEELSAEVRKNGSAKVKSSQNILIASNGSLDGLLTPNSELSTPNLLLAQATNLPTSADLAQTIEVQFTPEITVKAQELQNNPVKIYEYVRNNFDYEPYYGSLKGAQQTLLEKAGNDFDQANLLISLLRASNIPARYVYGTVEIPIEKLMNWVGGVTDSNTAAQILATAGVPGKLITEGGKIKHAQMEHVWVEAYVPYGNYRGVLHDDSLKAWIPLDPSFKQYEYKSGMDLYAAMGINGEQYIMDYIIDTSPSPIPAELQDLFSDYSINPYQFYNKRLLNYMDTNFPYATIEEIIGDETIAQTKTIIKKEYPYLLGSLPYKVITKGATYSSILDSLRHRTSFTIINSFIFDTALSYSITLPEVAGKRITLSYIPANSTDEALVTRYGSLLNVPPYLINVKPVIKINGIIAVTGNPVGLGNEQTFNMSFIMPNKKTDIVTNRITAGDYSAIAIQYYKTPVEIVGEKMRILQNNTSSSNLDDLLGQMLYNIGISYMHHLNFEEELYAKNFQMVITKEPSEAVVTSQAITEWLWGVPFKVTEGGVGIDVDRNINTSFPIDGNQQRRKDFMIVSGLGSSSWEDMILQSFLNTPSVSAARLLKIANQQGIPVYTIDSSNINTMLPQLQVSQKIIDDISNGVNAGKKIIISKTNVQYNEWNGVGYIVFDPAKGSGAYMISGGLAGADTSKPLPTSQRDLNALYARLCDQTRWTIIKTAGSLIGTLYRFGAKDPTTGYIDCSGFVAYCYATAGINTLNGKNAALQYEASHFTDYPLYADLVFFKNTYKVGISHVGIALPYRLMIHAGSSKGVTLAPVDDFSSDKFAGYQYVDMPACK